MVGVGRWISLNSSLSRVGLVVGVSGQIV